MPSRSFFELAAFWLAGTAADWLAQHWLAAASGACGLIAFIAYLTTASIE